MTHCFGCGKECQKRLLVERKGAPGKMAAVVCGAGCLDAAAARIRNGGRKHAKKLRAVRRELYGG